MSVFREAVVGDESSKEAARMDEAVVKVGDRKNFMVVYDGGMTVGGI